MTVLAIDPGQNKCGVALVAPGQVLYQDVVERVNLAKFLTGVLREHQIDEIVLGDGTGSSGILGEIKGIFPEERIVTVDEKFSTEEARRRYWQERKPAGWRRLLPTSLQLPPEPYDDYVAVILAERYLTAIGAGFCRSLQK